MQGRYNVLFLCTGNSARSIMAEAILNKKGFPNFTAYSAGSHATGRVYPQALRQLEMAKLPTEGLRSKNWDEFAKPGSPELHFVFTVPEVVQVMHEEGIDLNGVKPQFLSEELARQTTLLVTMGCGDACPLVPGLKKLDWPLSDPKG